jgi:PqqD family protein of HPr-rel-A system
MNPNTRWQSVSNIELYTTQEDDDSIIYNPLSGETHQLNLMAVDALNFLQDPAPVIALTEHICMLYQTDNTDDINRQMLRLIEQFDELGLIEPCQP